MMNCKEALRNWPLSLAAIAIVISVLFYWLPGKIMGTSLCCLISGVGWWAVPGMLLSVPGLAVFIWSVLDLVIRGRGTPSPLVHPKKIVTTGLYRCVRNPMYLGILAVIAGEAVMFRSWNLIYYLLAAFGISFLVILIVEEPLLKYKFGKDYLEYKKEVPRSIPKCRCCQGNEAG